MKRTIFYALVMMMMVALPSCWEDDDHFSVGDMALDWATVVRQSNANGGEPTLFKADTWGELLPINNHYFTPLEPNQRVVIYFNPLDEDDQGESDFLVKVENLKTVLTKSVEILTDANEEEYGNDPVYILEGDIWVGGGYLNIIFKQYLPVERKHRVSLVAKDNSMDEEGYLNLEFRYNDYDDTTNKYQFGAVSYSLHGMDINEQTKGIKLKLNSAVNGERVIKLDLNQKNDSSDRIRGLELSGLLAE